MKKLLLPFEGGHYPQELLDFVEMAGKVDPVLLTAAFVPESDYAGMLLASGVLEDAAITSPEQEDKLACQYRDRIERFCADRDIKHRVQLEHMDFPLPAIEKESRYADLLLLSSHHFLEDLHHEQPNAWMKNLLRQSECPCLLLPDTPQMPGEIVLAYDGSSDSVFAIRQFAYLFPEFANLRTSLVYVNEDPHAVIPHEASIRDLCKTHFRNLRVGNLKMKGADFFKAWIGMMNNPWLVAGSYGRSAFSDALRKSFSSELIRKHQIPLFIAHR